VDVAGEIETYKSILQTTGDICADIGAAALITGTRRSGSRTGRSSGRRTSTPATRSSRRPASSA
jgi:hypothetical protein